MQQRMAIARERAGLTQKELAEKVYRLSGRKLDQAVISNLERGKAGSSKRLPVSNFSLPPVQFFRAMACSGARAR